MKELMIATQDGNRCVYTSEPTGCPQLICIHGGMGLSSETLMEGLLPLQSEFDLIFIDQRGCGKSEAASNDRYELSDFAQDISEIVDLLGTSRPRGIFGHSLGGMIAIQTLATFPKLFDFAIIANSALNDEWRKAAGEAVASLNDPAIDEANANFGREPLRADLLREIAVCYGPVYFPELKPDEAKQRMAKFSYNAAAIGYTGSKVYPGMDLSAQVREIRIPSLVVAGEMDGVVPKDCQAKIAKDLAEGTLAVIDRAGHFPFVTECQQTQTAIINWWNEIRRNLI